nr:SWIB/MDM2 domain,Plus-3,GYF, putative isoform 2 [Ipomoea batatas]
MKDDPGFWVEETNDQFSFPLKRKRSFKSKKLVFVGWGSKPLIEFLQSIGRETSREYSRHEVNAIILDYVNSNNLLNPQKKKRILCDERLKTLFGKKSIPRIKIYDLLEVHFIENRDDSDEENSSAQEDAEEEDGVKKTFGPGDAGLETYLQLSNWTKDVLISSLSEDDFSEAECEDLRERVKAGLLKRLTVVELELKAHDLHEDITKHWIDKEIKMLQRRIDHANEKGWRREYPLQCQKFTLYEYLQKRQLLMTKSEQERLLSEKPKVVAEELEPEATKAGASERDEEKSGSPEPEQTRLFGESLKAEAKEPEKETMPLDAPEEPEKETMPLDAPEKPEKKTMPLDASKEVGAVKCFPGSTLRGPSDLLAAGMALSLQVATSPTRNLYSSFKEAAKESVVIELSDDDEDGAIANGNQLVSPCPRPVDEKVWYYMDPQGVVQGPFTLIQLREWYTYSYFHPKFCVWKAGQGPQQPVLLVDVLRRYSMI